MPSIQAPKPVRDKNDFVCPVCGERYKTDTAYKDHWYAVHPTDERCPICQAIVPRADWLKHRALHDEETRHHDEETRHP
jgi:transcription initiation factor IIE alpha subunit